MKKCSICGSETLVLTCKQAYYDDDEQAHRVGYCNSKELLCESCFYEHLHTHGSDKE